MKVQHGPTILKKKRKKKKEKEKEIKQASQARQSDLACLHAFQSWRGSFALWELFLKEYFLNFPVLLTQASHFGKLWVI